MLLNVNFVPLQKVTHKCFIKCVYSPGTDLDSREKVYFFTDNYTNIALINIHMQP